MATKTPTPIETLDQSLRLLHIELCGGEYETCRSTVRHRCADARAALEDVEAGERHLQSLKDDSGDVICDLEDQVKRLEASLRSEGSCVVCWTASWEPVENKEDCTIAEHPHPEEGCLRCGYCAQEKAYKELEAENEQLRKSNRALARAALEAERGCPSCAHCQLKRGGHLA